MLAAEGPEVVTVLERVTPERDVSSDISTSRIPLDIRAVEVIFSGDGFKLLNIEELQHSIEVSETCNQDVLASRRPEQVVGRSLL